MKKIILIKAMLLWAASSFAQDVPSSQVPSVILNSFKEQFSKATDIEWEIKGDQYNVEFDIGSADHELWFDHAGKVVKHQEDISKGDLPEPIAATISRDFENYRVSDARKIQAQNSIIYQLEVENSQEEWEMTLGKDGKVIEKRAD